MAKWNGSVIRMPRRHDPLPSHLSEEGSAFCGILISQQRKGRHFTRTVAEHAILIENGCNILRKCGRRPQGRGERTNSKDQKQTDPYAPHEE
jgi:hypothetical protein